MEMHRLTLAFADRELEGEYRRSRNIGPRAYAVGTSLTMLLWIVVGGWLRIVAPNDFGRLVTFLVFTLAPLFTLLLVLPPMVPERARRRVISVAGPLGSLMAGFVLLGLYVQASEPRLTANRHAALVGFLLTLQVFTNARFLYSQAISWTFAVGWEVGFLALKPWSLLGLADDLFWILVAQLIGSFVSYTGERRGRRVFLARRTAERERTRADVAERARHLAESLLRVSVAPGRGLLAGALLDDRYRVVRELGKGGMGAVYEVERISDQRRLALKVLSGVADREALVRFAREAQIAAQMDHPNVVSILDVDVSRSGMLFLVMELVPGESLAAVKSRWGDPDWARPILKQIAAALAAMHARGIVHRDLKPANVLLHGDVVKVADFGIASLRPPDEGDSTLTKAMTRTGAFMGTPIYMAPELVTGAREAEPAADVWSFGILAHQLLTGGLPFSEAPVLARLEGRAARIIIAVADQDLSAMVRSCIDETVEARPTASRLGDWL